MTFFIPEVLQVQGITAFMWSPGRSLPAVGASIPPILIPPSRGRFHSETYGRTTGSGNKRNSSPGRCGTRSFLHRRAAVMTEEEEKNIIAKPSGWRRSQIYYYLSLFSVT